MSAAIADLVHRYSDGVTRHDFEQWTACWAEDATWSVSPDHVMHGRDEIVAFLHHAYTVLEGVVQHVVHGEVALDGATGTGRWHIQEHYRRTRGAPGLLLAHYDDTYAQIDGCWVFTSRTLTRHYDGPPDLSGTFAAAKEVAAT